MNATPHHAFGSLHWQGVLAFSNLVKTWNPQAVGTNRCLGIPFRFGPPWDPQGCLVCPSKRPHPGRMLSQYALTTVSKCVILEVL